MSFYEMYFYEMSFYEMSFYEMTFYEMTFYEMSQRHMRFYKNKLTFLVCSLVHLMVLVYVVRGENVGWKSYLEENPTEFHDLPLTWEPGSKEIN